MMNHRQVKTVLWSTSGVLACAAIAAMAWGVAAPLKVEPSADSSWRAGPMTPFEADAVSEPLPPVEAFSAVWRKPVRAPLFIEEAPPPTASRPEPQASPPPQLRIKLLATAIEDGRSCAVLLNEQNLIEVKRVGESSGDAKVIRIEVDRVEFQHHGRNVTLTTPEVYGAPGPSPAAAVSRRERP